MIPFHKVALQVCIRPVRQVAVGTVEVRPWSPYVLVETMTYP